MTRKKIEERDGWLWDRRGNRNEIARYGSREAAEKALLSLKNCDNCVNCSGCSDCSGCSYCSGCSRCSYCSGCSRCSGCSDCSRCSGCSDCSGCSGCSGCSDCSRCSYCSRCSDCSGCSYCSRCSGCSYCSRCSGCSDCSRCSYCSRCSDCSRCSYCSRCSRCSYLRDKRGITADNSGEAASGPPSVPVIPDIHSVIYAAASQPAALAMDSWHTCANTHCRAGWVVTLAGEDGKALERFYNTELAAMMIYDASAPDFKINPARFYDKNEAALADMKRLAEQSA